MKWIIELICIIALTVIMVELRSRIDLLVSSSLTNAILLLIMTSCIVILSVPILIELYKKIDKINSEEENNKEDDDEEEDDNDDDY